MKVVRTNLILRPNPKRVLFRPFDPKDPHRSLKIIARVMALTEEEVDLLLEHVLAEFRERHHKPRQFFEERFEAVREHLLTDSPLSRNRRLLIGAYFTQEYSLESAALFNPSLLWHPDQCGVPPGSKRFILSLRATGEGHISSITFRTGIIDAQCRITIDEPSPFVVPPKVVPDAQYDRELFRRKLLELGLGNEFAEHVMASLDDRFTMHDLEEAVSRSLRHYRPRHGEFEATAAGILALAKSNYQIEYATDTDLSERVIFPYSPTELNGIEDARFVAFQEENGKSRYIATYTAFDGRLFFPQILETQDFLRFQLNTLNGPEARNKGMALFPRRIRGLYAMLSRQDNENLFIMYSDMLHFWYTKELVLKPTYPWEYVQLGNCGSPLETEEGWLVLTHGVGPMRKYSIGAVLLDRDDPRKVIGRLREPLLAPTKEEREGYVPNVVYSCGAQIHRGNVILPYAMSDYATTFAIIPLRDLLIQLKKGVPRKNGKLKNSKQDSEHGEHKPEKAQQPAAPAQPACACPKPQAHS